MWRSDPPAASEVRGTVGIGWLAASLGLTVVGAGAFALGVSGAEAQRAWQAFFANFLFWTGLSFGAVMFSPTLTMSHGKWGRPLKRLAEAPAAFLPVSFVLFWVMYPGREEIFPWARSPVPGRVHWLGAPNLFLRDGAALFALMAVGLGIVYASVRRDLRAVGGSEPQRRSAETVLSPVFGILYAVVLSLLAFDLIMALDREWYSTLFGGYFFIGCFYTGLAALLVAGAIAARSKTLAPYVGRKQLKDLATLVFAFAIVFSYLFYTQLLVIWYGTLRTEARFLIERVVGEPWGPLAWTVFGLVAVVPFIVLLSRRIKSQPLPMLILGVVILGGMWLERFLLVAPSVWNSEGVPLGWLEGLITLGFLGIAGFCTLLFLRVFPMVPVSDPLFQELLANRGQED